MKPPTDVTPSAGAQAKHARMSFPLPAKILACFFLNLLFFAVVAAFVVQGQFRFGLDSLLAGRSGERLQAMSEAIVSDLNRSPRAQWPEILKGFADAYQVQIAAVRNDGTRLAGTIMDPPAPVLARLAEGAPARGRAQVPPVRDPREGTRRDLRPVPPPEGVLRDGQPRDPARGFPPGSTPPNFFPAPRDGAPQPRDGGPPPREGAPPLRDRDPGPPLPEWMPRDGPPPPGPGTVAPYFPKFILRAGQPQMYWIGVRAPLPDDEGRRLMPTSLLIALPSLASGGLLLDVTPWLWIGAAVLACSALLWLPLVRGITRSIRQMTGAAGQMAQGQFGTRVDTERRDELGRLGESLNHMAGRLGEYVTGQKRFLGDIAHELCSPLARMEMALGVLEQRAGAEQQGHVNDVREEVRHMSSLVNELLSFTKAGLRAKDIALNAVPLAALCARVIAREALEKSDIAVNVDAAVSVLADPDLLARAVANVLRNAVRYAGGVGPILITATARGADVLLAIADRGPGVPPETLHRLFDPFYRPETARTREGGGIGLGLAIVKSCVEACGGTVAVKNAQPCGLEVTMTLRRPV